MTSLYYENIKVLPSELPSKYNENELKDIILEKLKNKIGNKCNKYGYIKKDSIIIINKSTPKIISQHFDGSLYYKLEYNANIINPIINNELKCKIQKINKMGILANNDCMYIVIPYELDNNINNIQLDINDDILIKIIGTNFEIYDTEIKILGEFIKKIN